MRKIDKNTSTKPVRQMDPLIKGGFRRETSVSVPLDFLQGISSIAQRSLERQPPKLKLNKRGQGTNQLEDLKQLADISPVLSKETSEIAYQVVEMTVRRQKEIENSGDLGARRGLDALERICHMFEHVYVAKSNLAGRGNLL